jgi:hypothetical protein
MGSKNGRRPLVREGEPKQKTKQGLEIPVPKARDIEDALIRVSKRGRGKREKPS